jgi:cation transport ATPase
VNVNVPVNEIGKIMLHTYEIEGMHCSACATKISAALQSIPEVSHSDVTLNPPEARVEMNRHVPVSTLQNTVSSVGAYTLREKLPAFDDDRAHSTDSAAIDSGSLVPLFVIVGYIVGGILVRAAIANEYSWHVMMTNFMGSFFVLFSLFKMIDIRGFADAYAAYDLIASRSRFYALAYPFIELGLGLAYLVGVTPLLTNLITLILMTIGAIGVFRALRGGRTIQCACLGTALNLPMTKVTLLEDVVMGVMALVMLFLLL